MDNERESFIFYKSFYEALKEAEPKIQNEVFVAICKKGLYDEDTELNGVSKMLYTLIKPQLEANTKRYNDGKKGGRPKKEKTTGYENKKTTGYENKKPNNNVNDNVNDNDNENNNDNILCSDDVAKIDKIFIETLGSTNINNIKECIEYLDQLPLEVIENALKITARNNAKWNYARSILDSYIEKGLNTLEKIQADEIEFKNRTSQKPKEETEEEKTARKIKALEEGLKNANW